MNAWPSEEIRPLALEELGERYRRYRLTSAESERAMASSLARYGQISPVVVCLREDRWELVDGFKRLSAARQGKRMETLSSRRIEADERAAKAAVYALNCVGSRPQELEEAWIVQALVREDGLSQVEAAELLGRHKSWVCRRLALLERLCAEAREDLRLGLLSPTKARELVRLPAGNQTETLLAARREELSAAELRGVVELILGSAGTSKVEFVLAQPREALRQARQILPPSWDPRLSALGNRIQRQLANLLEQLSRMETWLSHRGRAELTLADRVVVRPGFVRLARDARGVSELARDLLGELSDP